MVKRAAVLLGRGSALEERDHRRMSCVSVCDSEESGMLEPTH
jgi:hypothetical protein